MFKVVYLDDEPELCEIFTSLFSSDEVEIRAFTDPLLAIAHITKSKPNLFFTDYYLPKTNGEQIAEALGKDIPIVLVSGALDLDCKFRFDAFLKKPFRKEDVQALINGFRTKSAS